MLSTAEIINGLVGSLIENLTAKYGDRFPEPARKLLRKLGFVPDKFEEELRLVLSSSMSRLFEDYPDLVNHNLSETVILPLLTHAVDVSLYAGETPDVKDLRLEFDRIQEHEWEITALERTQELNLDAMLQRFLEYLDKAIMDAATMSDRAVMVTVSKRIARTEGLLSVQVQTIINLLNQILADKQVTSIQERPFMVRELPPYLIHLSVENEILGQLIDTEHLRPSGNTVVIWGPGGSGKSTLAEAVCHSKEVKETFSDGILWVTLGKADSDHGAIDTIMTALRKIYTAITDKRPEFIDLEQAEKSVSQLVRGKNYLFILDDVWNIPNIEQLLVSVQSCTRLITTRIAAVAETANGIRLDLDDERLTLDEAVQILSWGLNTTSSTIMPLETLAKRLGKLPLLLGLVNNAIRRRLSFTGSVDEAVDIIGDYLTRYGAVDFKPDSLAERDATIAASIELSLENLPQTTRERFHELRIFLRQSEIPRSVINSLWLSSAGLDEFETAELVYDLWNSALIKYDHRTKTIRVHDIIHEYLRQQSFWDGDLHRGLLEAYENSHWRDVILDEPYFARHLEYHLVIAFRDSELTTIYKDLQYLARKTWIVQADAVEWRLNQLIRGKAKNDPELIELDKAFRQNSHLLYYCKDFKDLCNTLHSRLAHNPILSELLLEFEAFLEKPFIVPIRRIPDLPNPAQIRLIPVYAGLGTRDLLSKDGKVVVTYGRDRLVVHNIETLRIIFEYKGSVDCCALNEDGTRLVLFDPTVMWTVWDLSSQSKINEYSCRDIIPIPRFCAMSGDGNVIVFTNIELSYDNNRRRTNPRLNIWDISNDAIQSIDVSREFTDLDISTNGKVIVSSHKDGWVRIWHVDNLDSPVDIKAGARFCCLTSTGTVVATASEWGWNVLLWDTRTGEVTYRFKSPERLGQVSDIAISGDGNSFALVANDIGDGSYFFKVWDVLSGLERLSIEGTDYSHATWTCSISDDSRIIVTSTLSGTKVWNGEATYTQDRRDYIADCVMSDDGSTLIAAFKEGKLVKWDVQQIEELNTYYYSDDEDIRGTEIYKCAINANGTIAVVTGFHTYEGLLKVVDLEDGKVLATFKSHSSIRSCSIDNAGDRLCFGGLNTPLRIYDLRQEKDYSPPVSVADELGVCKVSPDGKSLIVGFWDGTIGKYDFETSDQIWSVKGHAGPVVSCVTSSDGSTLVSQEGFSSAGNIIVWDFQNGQERYRLPFDEGYHGCTLNRDGTLGVFTFSSHISVWDFIREKTIATIQVDGSLGVCAWSPDFNTIVVEGDHGLYWLELKK